MKHTLIFVAISTLLAACSDKPSDKPAAALPTAAPAYLKAEAARPVSLPVTLVPTDTCFIDAINEQLAKEANPIADKTKVKFEGWAADVATGTTAQEIYIELEGAAKFYIKANPGIKRLDVASAFNKPSLENAGWLSFADLSALGAGSYKMRVIQVNGTSGFVCDAKPIIDIN
jgi:hypothetical protein